jgi:hypothetical protein
MNLATLAAVGVSLAALAHLAATDPKRRRAFRLPEPGPRRPGVVWAAALLPGLLLPVSAGAGGFFVWLGAVAVLGWAIAALSPNRSAILGQLTHDLLLKTRAGLEPLLRSAGEGWRRALRPPQDRALAQRVRELEAEVAVLKARLTIAAGSADVVVELPRSAEPLRSSRQG